MRLFIAIELPENVKEQLSRLRTAIPDARWVTPGQLHLTLAFLGHVPAETQAALEQRLAAIHLPCFFLCFTRTGCFPNRRRPRVVWAGVKPEPLLDALAARIRETVLSCGIHQEERPFSPHITLARIKARNSTTVPPFSEQAIQSDIPPVEVREFTLFSSSLGAAGAVHTVIKSFQLGV